jgi:hypothetical protein
MNALPVLDISLPQDRNLGVCQENRYREETQYALREIAYALTITERVKAAILEEPELCASVMA